MNPHGGPPGRRISVGGSTSWVATVLALLIGCSPDVGDAPSTGLQVVRDSTTGSPALTLRRVLVRNAGAQEAYGDLSLAIVDSIGHVIWEDGSDASRPLHFAPADHGGVLATAVSLGNSPEFVLVTDSLLRARSRFGVRVILSSTAGGAAHVADVGSREWGRWQRMLPGAETTLRFALSVPESVGRARLRVEIPRRPAAMPDPEGEAEDGATLGSGLHEFTVRAQIPQSLPLGGLLAVRLTLVDPETGSVLQQQERIAIHDTTPPLLSNYRAVVLRDGRVAIQVTAGDREAGVAEDAVASLFSLDQGATWTRAMHRSQEDGFGRPALFETVLGPFPAGSALLLEIEATDRAGNRNARLPADGVILAAPRNAEWILDSLEVDEPDGSPIFWTEVVALRAAARPGPASAPEDSVGERFERRRISQLLEVPRQFGRWGVSPAGFIPLPRSQATIMPGVDSMRSTYSLRMPAR